MSTNSPMDVLLIGAGPSALSIAAALGQEKLKVGLLSLNDPSDPWPYTYGIWGEEVDELGFENLLKHRWSNTVSFLGEGSTDKNSPDNQATRHNRDYGLFDKKKLQEHWLNQCRDTSVNLFRGKANTFEINKVNSTVITSDGKRLTSKLIVDATG